MAASDYLFTKMYCMDIDIKVKTEVMRYMHRNKELREFIPFIQPIDKTTNTASLFLSLPKHDYTGAFITIIKQGELLSKRQINFLNDMANANHFTAVCKSVDEAVKVARWYFTGKEKSEFQ